MCGADPVCVPVGNEDVRPCLSPTESEFQREQDSPGSSRAQSNLRTDLERRDFTPLYPVSTCVIIQSLQNSIWCLLTV